MYRDLYGLALILSIPGCRRGETCIVSVEMISSDGNRQPGKGYRKDVEFLSDIEKRLVSLI
jgi:hypothetical protein